MRVLGRLFPFPRALARRSVVGRAAHVSTHKSAERQDPTVRADNVQSARSDARRAPHIASAVRRESGTDCGAAACYALRMQSTVIGVFDAGLMYCTVLYGNNVHTAWDKRKFCALPVVPDSVLTVLYLSYRPALSPRERSVRYFRTVPR
jgi:hypothetical protein